MLGVKKKLQDLVSYIGESGFKLYLYGVTDYANDSTLLDGFFASTDAARLVSKEVAELHSYSTVSYVDLEGTDTYYLLKGKRVLQMAQNLAAEAQKLGSGVSFQNIGCELSSDFDKDEPMSRMAQLRQQEAMLREVSASGQGVMTNMGNDYAIAYTDIVANMDLSGSGYTILDRTVPFYQIAVHGYVNYTGESLNLTQDYEEELLLSAEYGAGLSFTLMEETAFVLQKTLYTEYFGAGYDAWHDRMLEIYTRYNEELGHIFGQKMTDHQWLADKVSCTVYEDGTKVYVNYGYQDYTAQGGDIVPARDYKAVR